MFGPVIEPGGDCEAAESGHATAVVHGASLYLFFQERADGGRWSYGVAEVPLRRIA